MDEYLKCAVEKNKQLLLEDPMEAKVNDMEMKLFGQGWEEAVGTKCHITASAIRHFVNKGKWKSSNQLEDVKGQYVQVCFSGGDHWITLDTVNNQMIHSFWAKFTPRREELPRDFSLSISDLEALAVSIGLDKPCEYIFCYCE